MHSFRVRVYFSDTDAGGIIYHARYLDFAEHARTEMLRSALPDLSEHDLSGSGMLFVVRSINIDYLKPGYLDDELEVQTSIASLGAVSALLTQNIIRGDDILASMTVRVAFIDKETKKPMRIPPEVRESLSCYTI